MKWSLICWLKVRSKKTPKPQPVVQQVIVSICFLAVWKPNLPLRLIFANKTQKFKICKLFFLSHCIYSKSSSPHADLGILTKYPCGIF